MTGSALLTSIDLYCERTTAAFWAEPVNALTNAAFLMAALIGWRAARSTGRRDGPMILLIALTASIGVGSFLFHTVATRWAALADVVPISLFIVDKGYRMIARVANFDSEGMIGDIELVVAW